MAINDGAKHDGDGTAASHLALIGTITDKVGTPIDFGAKSLRLINNRLTLRAARQAFRDFTMISPTLVLPALNRFGTLRGMVTSADWRHAFAVHISYARTIEEAGKVADFLGWANYIAGWGEEIASLSQSAESWDTKAPKLCFYATTALAKIFIGSAHGLTDLTIYGAQAACSIGRVAGGGGMQGVAKCSNYGDILRAAVGVGFKKEEEFVSPENIQAALMAGGGAAVAATWNLYDTSKSYISHIFK